jgi:uncharacterized membrane protein
VALLAAVFIAAFFWLTTCQHVTLRKRAPDPAVFDQAIWNTLPGRFMFSTIKDRSVLANRLSLYMAFLCRLRLVWSDVRILYLAQGVGLAIAGLFLHRVVLSCGTIPRIAAPGRGEH